jgi:hypothetical protein
MMIGMIFADFTMAFSSPPPMSWTASRPISSAAGQAQGDRLKVGGISLASPGVFMQGHRLKGRGFARGRGSDSWETLTWQWFSCRASRFSITFRHRMASAGVQGFSICRLTPADTAHDLCSLVERDGASSARAPESPESLTRNEAWKIKLLRSCA